MALPVDIISEASLSDALVTDLAQPITGNGWVKEIGPYCDSNDNVYMIWAEEPTAGDYEICVVKSTEPGVSAFAEQDNAGRPAAPNSGTGENYFFSSCFDGTKIHIVQSWHDTGGDTWGSEYHCFDTASDTWETINEAIASFTANHPTFPDYGTNPDYYHGPEIFFRPGETTDELMVIMDGDSHLSGSYYNTLDIYHKNDSATTWSGPVSLDSTLWYLAHHHADIDVGSDNVHVSYSNAPGNTAGHWVTVVADNSLGTKYSYDGGFGMANGYSSVDPWRPRPCTLKRTASTFAFGSYFWQDDTPSGDLYTTTRVTVSSNEISSNDITPNANFSTNMTGTGTIGEPILGNAYCVELPSRLATHDTIRIRQTTNFTSYTSSLSSNVFGANITDGQNIRHAYGDTFERGPNGIFLGIWALVSEGTPGELWYEEFEIRPETVQANVAGIINGQSTLLADAVIEAPLSGQIDGVATLQLETLKIDMTDPDTDFFLKARYSTHYRLR